MALNLVELRVRNLGVIDDVTVHLGPGMTALTGETGAGKTLLVQAIGLLLGGRADPAMVRAGADEALIEGRFGPPADPVGPAPPAGRPDGPEVVVARSVVRSGRSRAWIDGRMATRRRPRRDRRGAPRAPRPAPAPVADRARCPASCPRPLRGDRPDRAGGGPAAPTPPQRGVGRPRGRRSPAGPPGRPPALPDRRDRGRRHRGRRRGRAPASRRGPPGGGRGVPPGGGGGPACGVRRRGGRGGERPRATGRSGGGAGRSGPPRRGRGPGASGHGRARRPGRRAPDRRRHLGGRPRAARPGPRPATAVPRAPAQVRRRPGRGAGLRRSGPDRAGRHRPRRASGPAGWTKRSSRPGGPSPPPSRRSPPPRRSTAPRLAAEIQSTLHGLAMPAARFSIAVDGDGPGGPGGLPARRQRRRAAPAAGQGGLGRGAGPDHAGGPSGRRAAPPA